MEEQSHYEAVEMAQRIVQRFRTVFSQWRDDRLPVDEVVTWLGLHVALFHPEDRPTGTYGYVDPDEGQLIWLCRGLPDQIRRFTLAHELGHMLLHCHATAHITALLGDMPSVIATTEYAFTPSTADPCSEADVQNGLASKADQEQFQERLGIGLTYDPRSQRELAANIFAAELLMPLARVRTLYLVEQVPPRSLAERFHVSTPALLNRLVELLNPPEETAVPRKKQEVVPQSAKKTYDIFQQAAIEAPTPALIVAGPGSGKTSTLIGRVEYTIGTLGVPPQQILALTFSRKAAQEMAERLQKVLVGPLPMVSTFHAYCAELLRQHGSLVGLRPDFALIDEAEGYFLLRQQANTIDLRHYQFLHAPTYYFPDMLRAISRAKDELVSPAHYAQVAQAMLQTAHDEEATKKAEKAVEVARIYALYHEGLQQRGDTDFGGLLMLAIQLLTEHPEVLREQQQRYRYILVDEFQDVNRASGVLLRVLAGTARRVWVVGDANQAIYGFRGASPANITRFEQDFPGAAVLPLSRNYRSRPDLVRIAESFRCIQLELGQEIGKNEPVRLTQHDTYVTIAKAADEVTEIDGMIRDIQRRRADGYSYNDMVVLCRTRAHVQKISRALTSTGFPVIERGGLLEQEHIKNVVALLLLMTDMSGSGLLRLARQGEHPLHQEDIETFFLAAREQKLAPAVLLYNSDLPLTLSTEGRQSLFRIGDIWHDLQSNTTLWSLLAQYLFLETTLMRDLLSSSAKNIQGDDYNALLQLARHYDQQQRNRNALVATPAAQNSSSLPIEEQARGFLEYLNLLILLRQDGTQRQQGDESDDTTTDRLRVMTVHASKGLEFPLVYMPGLVQQRFPMSARGSTITAPTGMVEGSEEVSETHESGESCLFYVGVTRARDAVILSYSTRYGKRNYKRSLYLDALEAGLNGERITNSTWATATEERVVEDEQEKDMTLLSEAFINATKPTTLHVSAVEAYLRCPRQYAYNTLYNFNNQENGYLLFRQATQKTVETLRNQLQGLHQKMPQSISPEEVRALYTKHWHEIGGPDAAFASLYERHGHEVLAAIQHELMTHGDVRWEMQPRYPVEINGHTVQVTIDRVELEQHKEAVKVATMPHVETTHTSPQPSTSAGKKAPAASDPNNGPIFKRTSFGKQKEKPTIDTRELFYTLAYRQHFPDQAPKLYSHNMSTGEAMPIKLLAKKEQNLYEKVEQALQGMERNEFPAHPDEQARCSTCPFFLICPA